jgi:hypothetical protein
MKKVLVSSLRALACARINADGSSDFSWWMRERTRQRTAEELRRGGDLSFFLAAIHLLSVM